MGGSRWQASAPTAPPVLPARSRPSASTPETWAKFTQENLHRAERERLASVNLRELIDCILRDTAEDLRLQRDAVNLAFERRCAELEDTLHKLEQHLHKGPAWSLSVVKGAQTVARRGRGPGRPLVASCAPGHYLVTTWTGPCAVPVWRDPRSRATPFRPPPALPKLARSRVTLAGSTGLAR